MIERNKPKHSEWIIVLLTMLVIVGIVGCISIITLLNRLTLIEDDIATIGLSIATMEKNMETLADSHNELMNVTLINLERLFANDRILIEKIGNSSIFTGK